MKTPGSESPPTHDDRPARPAARQSQRRWQQVWEPQFAWLMMAATVLLPAAEVLMRRDPEFHPHFELEAVPAFSVWFSLGAIAVLVGLAWVGTLLIGDSGNDDER